MVVYTRTGDDGTTTLIGGKRVLKCDPQVEACGTIDELSSFIGLIIFIIKDKDQKKLLTAIQKDLHRVMAFLAGGEIDLPTGGLENRVLEIEKLIDDLEKKLPKINKFILPQGNEAFCWFQIIRTTCRKAERKIVYFFHFNNDIKNSKSIIKYLNRLSDLFFVLGRTYNKKELFV